MNYLFVMIMQGFPRKLINFSNKFHLVTYACLRNSANTSTYMPEIVMRLFSAGATCEGITAPEVSPLFLIYNLDVWTVLVQQGKCPVNYYCDDFVGNMLLVMNFKNLERFEWLLRCGAECADLLKPSHSGSQNVFTAVDAMTRIKAIYTEMNLRIVIAILIHYSGTISELNPRFKGIVSPRDWPMLLQMTGECDI